MSLKSVIVYRSRTRSFTNSHTDRLQIQGNMNTICEWIVLKNKNYIKVTSHKALRTGKEDCDNKKYIKCVYAHIQATSHENKFIS